jgi:hypothetical protein
VGIALDVEAGKLYWTQKGPDNAGEGRILGANLEIPEGQTLANRKDVELLHDNLPETIDLELDLDNRTDRRRDKEARSPTDPFDVLLLRHRLVGHQSSSAKIVWRSK